MQIGRNVDNISKWKYRYDCHDDRVVRTESRLDRRVRRAAGIWLASPAGGRSGSAVPQHLGRYSRNVDHGYDQEVRWHCRPEHVLHSLRLLHDAVRHASALPRLLRPPANTEGARDVSVPPRIEAPGRAQTLGRLIEDVGRQLIAAEVDVLHEPLGEVTRAPWFVSVLDQLVLEIGQRSVRALVIELNLLRVGELLPKGGEREQYDAFVGALSQSEFRAYLERKYPVLFDIVRRRVRGAVTQATLLVERYRHDRLAINAEFGINLGPDLAVLELVGDAHNGGFQTAIVRDDAGNVVVYKPRSGAIDVMYDRVIEAVNTDLDYPLRSARSVQRAGYYWQEFMQGAVEQKVDDLRRLGAWLAVAHYTSLYDIHFENLIWSVEGPVIIDFECGFSGDLRFAGEQLLYRATLPTQVGLTGILPMRVGGAPEREENPNWGVVGEAESRDFGRLQYVVADGTPHARLVTEASAGEARSLVDHDTAPGSPTAEETPSHAHPPQDVVSIDWSDAERVERDLTEGFVAARRSLAARSDWLRSIAREYTGTTRVVLRPTGLYADIERRSSYPRYLVSFSARDEALREWLGGVADYPIESEMAALREGDIPYFSVGIREDKVGSRGVLMRPGLQVVEERLDQLADGDDELRQVGVLHRFLFAHYGPNPELLREVAPGVLGEDQVKSEIAMSMAALVRDSFTDSLGPCWMNLMSLPRGDWAVGASGPDLFQGAIGSTLSLATALACDFDVKGAEEIVESVVDASKSLISERDADTDPGLFSGLGGVVYFLAVLNQYSPEPSLESAISGGMTWIADRIDEVTGHDIITGHAGLLGLASKLSASGQIDEALFVRMRESTLSHLERTVIPTEHGVGWLDDEGDWLGGFSHGVGGVAWAAWLAGGPRAEKLAERAWASQLALRLPDGFTWLDKRDDVDKRNVGHMTAWCHGGDGLIIPALDGHAEFPGEAVSDLEFLTRWIGTPFPDDPSLCHGRAGRLALLSWAAGHPRMHDAAPDTRQVIENERARLRPQVVSDLQSSIWAGGTRIARHDGLMVGRAGSTLGLMIDQFGSRAPNPLTVDLPRL